MDVLQHYEPGGSEVGKAIVSGASVVLVTVLLKSVEFKCGCAAASLNNEPGESEVGKAMVSGGNIVLP